MKFLEAIGLALSAIKAHKLRSFLTLLGIIFGVAVVIVVVSMVEGFNNYFESKISDLGSNAFVVDKMGIITSMQEWMEKSRKNKDIKMDDLKAIKEKTNPAIVKDAAAQTRRRGTVKYESKALEDVLIQGATSNLLDIDSTKIEQGRFFTQTEEEHADAVCFVGHEIVKQYFLAVDPIGREIKIDGRPFRIIGIAQEKGSVFGNPQDNFLIMPISTYQNIFGSRGTIALRVAATSMETLEQAQDEVRVILRAKRHLKYQDADNFGIVSSDALNGIRDRIFGTVGIVAVGVTSIALVVGGIVIMNMMLVSVTERTREIGVRKSLGAKRSDILKQFLAESTTLSLVGGAAGVALAYGVSKIVTYALSFPTTLPLFWTIMALTVSASIGLFFGIYPAMKAAKLDPIEALRAD
jgi:putative ABC transport system permease protein